MNEETPQQLLQAETFPTKVDVVQETPDKFSVTVTVNGLRILHKVIAGTLD